MHGATALCLDLGELTGIELGADVLCPSRREMDALHALQLNHRRQAAVAVGGWCKIQFGELNTGESAGIAHVRFHSQCVASRDRLTRELQTRMK